MRIRLASILALLGCLVFSAARNTFASGEFDNFRPADAFNNKVNCSKNFDAFGGGTFDFANGFKFNFDRTSASNGPAVN